MNIIFYTILNNTLFLYFISNSSEQYFIFSNQYLIAFSSLTLLSTIYSIELVNFIEEVNKIILKPKFI
jgi:hypothetical protein